MVASSARVQRLVGPLARAMGSGMFGAQEHRFRLGAPLTEREVADFERHHGIVVPADYRAFITRIGLGPWPLRRYRTVLRPATRHHVGRGPRGGNPAWGSHGGVPGRAGT
jgi:hypothetical protein